jgi:acetylornithine deacetylase
VHAPGAPKPQSGEGGSRTVDPVSVARTLIDIDSTTGREAEAGAWLADYLRSLSYHVVQQPVSGDRFNVYAHSGTAPTVVFSTHFDCVPPFFPSREERGLLCGRGACDAKGIIAAQIAAAERLSAKGETRVGLLFVVGEERGSDGASAANDPAFAPDGASATQADLADATARHPGRYLINGEPTDNRLGSATRGVLRVRLHAEGRAAHSAFPELGESAIDKLLDALMVIRGLPLPEDPLLGRTHYTVGVIEGGVAPNVVSPRASAELLFRIVGDAAPVRAALAVVEGLVSIEHVLEVPATRLHTVPGFETAIFPYATDVPQLTRWGTPLLVGPGSIHVAHTDEEHVAIDELLAAVDLYEDLATRLIY